MSENKMEHARRRIQRSKLRLTPQRVAVLDYLLGTDLHPTVDEIHGALENDFPNISTATIYNNLHVLCENGLARELTFGNTSSRFDGDTTNHYHIICTNCKKVIDFHYPLFKEIEILAEQRTNFIINYHRLDIYGKCSECRKLDQHDSLHLPL